MRLIRFATGFFLLQGWLPTLLFGLWRPDYVYFITPALLYSLVGYWLWLGKRWALRSAAVLTAAQAWTLSSPLLSWRLGIGPTFGCGLRWAPSFWMMQIFTFRAFNLRFDGAAGGYNGQIVRSLGDFSNPSFLAFNVPAILLLALLLFSLFTRFPKQRLPFSEPPRAS